MRLKFSVGGIFPYAHGISQTWFCLTLLFLVLYFWGFHFTIFSKTKQVNFWGAVAENGRVAWYHFSHKKSPNITHTKITKTTIFVP